ncbi:fungal-specific transcription factor domain-containing protein [Corynascus similis CBS 632.67]
MPSPWLGSLSTGSTSVSASSSTVGFSHTGQLSPISNGVDLPCGTTHGSASLASPSQSPSVTATSHSTSSSIHPPSWPPAGYVGSGDTSPFRRPQEHHGARHGNAATEEDAVQALVPKLEPLDDDDFRMDDFQEAPLPSATPTVPSDSREENLDHPKQKRPRGRPRKHPLVPNIVTNKVTKGRSKTGCLTCRKRKKKCDEAKPRCMNCEKNAVVCEGYPEKQIWKSGKERAEEERLKSGTFPSITMRPLFHGLETAEDRIFWKHYNEHLSAVLTVESEHKNAFKDMMIPIAVKHRGLMHSILSLASKHIDYETPYGINILKNNPNTTVETLKQRSLYHHDQARVNLYRDIEASREAPHTVDKVMIEARYGQMLCFLLEALVEGNSRSEHRPHLQAYCNLISSSPPEDSPFLSFIAEFFQYHIFAAELIPGPNGHTARRLEPIPLMPSMHQPRLLGVADGLLDYLSQITDIRNTIRGKMMAQLDLAVDYQVLYQGSAIDGAIRDFKTYWPPGDSRQQVTLLYKQMLWIYLNRTVHLPSSTPPSMASSAVSLPSSAHGYPCNVRHPASVVNTPPQSASTSCASSPKFTASSHGSHHRTSRPSSQLGPPSRTQGSGLNNGETAAGCDNRADSPAPTRQPPDLEPDLAHAVEESLSLLEWFKPSDPCQTLLLLPCFLVGTACFSPLQQKRIRASIRAVRGYTGLRNADRVLQLLEEVWRLMEAGDWVAAWDWSGVAESLGLDFIPA